MSAYFQKITHKDDEMVFGLVSLSGIQTILDASDSTISGSLSNFLNGLSERPRNSFSSIQKLSIQIYKSCTTSTKIDISLTSTATLRFNAATIATQSKLTVSSPTTIIGS
jgi:hypothetical protein